MELTDEESLRPFKSFMDKYDESFYARNIEISRSLIYKSHETKVINFFKSGEIENLIRENVRVFVTGDMACITTILRYSSKPYPGVRTTYVLECEEGTWKLRHVHHSFDPNETTNIA